MATKLLVTEWDRIQAEVPIVLRDVELKRAARINVMIMDMITHEPIEVLHVDEIERDCVRGINFYIDKKLVRKLKLNETFRVKRDGKWILI